MDEKARLYFQMTVPLRSVKDAGTAIADDQRWADITRILADQTIPNDVRLVALLVLVFGQHTSRVCALTLDRVTETPVGLCVQFASDAIEMPIGLAEAVRDQVRAATSNPKGRRPDGKRWLFPGQYYGAHITPGHLGNRLVAIGVKSRPERNAALMSLASRLNPGIVASAFGLHINTATHWAMEAGQTFNGHVARRSSAALRG